MIKYIQYEIIFIINKMKKIIDKKYEKESIHDFI